jgi:hypothetical protein
MSARNQKINDLRARVGLGRRHAFDPRDRHYPMRRALEPKVAKEVTSKVWDTDTVLDQGSTPQCVAYSWTGFLLAAPREHSLKVLGGPSFPQALYFAAQKNDEFPGEDYDGSSVRGGAKALGLMSKIGEYIWATTADEARDFILTRGPIVLGTDWHVEMYHPDPQGYLKPEGAIDGGHAYLAIGFSRRRDAFRIMNSWGISWGERGRAWLKRADLQQLLERDGEACSALETVVTAGVPK